MHTQSLEPWQHQHVFLGERHDRHERRTWLVVALTSAMMVAEIVAGSLFGSMALLADGWHMSTHAGALVIAALAYRFARRYALDARFAFGTGKLGELAAFASAVILAVIALLIAYYSVERLLVPVPIRFGEAMAVAAIGLAVNLVSALLLFDEEHHHNDHEHAEGVGHHHARDHNIRAAYFHVLADALTSVTALVGLAAGSLYGWVWMDPLMGIVGALVIAYWSLGLIRSSGGVLLDAVPEARLLRLIRKRLEVDGDRVADLHVWRVGPGHVAVIAALVSDHPEPPPAYKARLKGIYGLSHTTIEVHACT